MVQSGKTTEKKLATAENIFLKESNNEERIGKKGKVFIVVPLEIL